MDAQTFYYLSKFLLATHIVSWIAWLSALFYVGRLFVYRKEAQEKGELDYQDQLRKMEALLSKRIAIPAMLLTWAAGLSLMSVVDAHLQGWFQIKFNFLLLIVIYQMFAARIRKQETITYSSTFLRFFNELLTIPVTFIVSLSAFRQTKPAFIASLVILVLLGLIGFTLARFRGKALKKGTR